LRRIESLAVMPQESLDNKKGKPPVSPRRRLIIGGLVILFICAVIGLSVGLSVGLAVRNNG
jgi:hypothetical protein